MSKSVCLYDATKRVVGNLILGIPDFYKAYEVCRTTRWQTFFLEKALGIPYGLFPFVWTCFFANPYPDSMIPVVNNECVFGVQVTLFQGTIFDFCDAKSSVLEKRKEVLKLSKYFISGNLTSSEHWYNLIWFLVAKSCLSSSSSTAARTLKQVNGRLQLISHFKHFLITCLLLIGKNFSKRILSSPTRLPSSAPSSTWTITALACSSRSFTASWKISWYF